MIDRPRRRVRRALLASSVAAVLALTACTGGDADEKKPTATPTSTLPAGLTTPAGTQLTEPGSTLTPGEAATIAWQPGDGDPVVARVNVRRIKQGKIKDFRFFSLDDQAKKSTPYYVTVGVANEGPAALSRAVLPLYAHDSTNAISLPNQLVGTFKPCPNGTMPKQLAIGQTATLCLVYLLPQGATLQSIDLVTTEQADAIRWKG